MAAGWQQRIARAVQSCLTSERCLLFDELEAIAFETGSVDTCQRIGIAAEERYDGHHQITQLLVRKNLKQCEFAEELVCALRNCTRASSARHASRSSAIRCTSI